jgi:type II secretory pathway predicted ATPase ExeA
MYEAFYHLGRDPFRLLPEAGVCFAHRSWERAWSHLRYALDRGEGIAVVTGPSGSGKTTLADRLFAEVDAAGAVGARLIADEQSATEVLRKLGHAFGLPADGLDRAMLRHRIESHLLELGHAGRRVVVIIDEAQALAHEALEAMRLLTDLQAQSRPVLQLFLFGQEELQEVMAAPWMGQFQDRVIVGCRLHALDLADTKSYLEYRLASAGWRGDPSIDGPAVAAIHRHTGGLPRQLNKVCGRLLLYGSDEGRHALGEPDVRTVVSELCDESLAPAAEGRAPGDAAPGPFESVYELALRAPRGAAVPGSTALAVGPLSRAASLSADALPRLIDRLRGHLAGLAALGIKNLPAPAAAGLAVAGAVAVVLLFVAGGDDEPVATRVGVAATAPVPAPLLPGASTTVSAGGPVAAGQRGEEHLTLVEGQAGRSMPAVAADPLAALPGMTPDPGGAGDGQGLFGGWLHHGSVGLPVDWGAALDESLLSQVVADAGDRLTAGSAWQDDTAGMAASTWADQIHLVAPGAAPEVAGTLAERVAGPVPGNPAAGDLAWDGPASVDDAAVVSLADAARGDPLDFAGFLPAPAAGIPSPSSGGRSVAPPGPPAIVVEVEPLPEEIPLAEGAVDPNHAPTEELAADPAAGPTPAAETSVARAAALVALGDAALAKDRLLLPEEESAYTYYRRALAIDAQDQGALAGMAQIVNRYAALATRALRDGRLERAERFVRRAQRVAPEDPGLEVLRGKVDRAVAQAEAEATLEQARLARIAAEVPAPEPVAEPQPEKGLNSFERVMQFVNGNLFGRGR